MSARVYFMITAFSVGITILNQRIIKEDDIEFVTEFPCFLAHPVFPGRVRISISTLNCFLINKALILDGMFNSVHLLYLSST